jgi:hypothetical protein
VEVFRRKLKLTTCDTLEALFDKETKANVAAYPEGHFKYVELIG